MKKYVKNAYLFLALAAASVILHNIIFAITKKEEGIFFSLTFIFFAAFIILLIYNLIYLKGKK